MYRCKQYLMKCSKNGKISTQNQVENWVEHFTRVVEVKCHIKYINAKEGANTNFFVFRGGRLRNLISGLIWFHCLEKGRQTKQNNKQ